jgi:hypothetical protein
MKALKIVFALGLLAFLLFMNAACITTPVCMSPSTVPIQSKASVQGLGRVSGSDTAWSILGLWMWGRPDIDAAVREAMGAKGGDALVNISCYETWRYFLLFSTTTVRIEGEAVRISEPAAAPARGAR